MRPPSAKAWIPWLAAMVAATACAGCEWEGQTANAGSKNFYGISCRSATTCVAVGAEGVIRRTTTSGKPEWSTVSSPTTATLRAVSCSGERICVAVGEAGAVVASANGGETFSSRGPLGSGVLYGVSCVEGRCVAVGGGGAIYATENGGESWVARSSPTTATLRAVFCLASGRCVAVGETGVIVAGEGFGSTWTKLSSPTTAPLYGVSCGSESCYAVGGGGALLKGPPTGPYAALASPTTAELNGISCAEEGRCTVVGAVANTYATMLYTRNGSTFQFGSADTTIHLFAASCPTRLVCYVAGESAGILRNGDGGGYGWSQQASPTTKNLYAIACAAPVGCLAAGAEGALIATTNGSSWTLLPPPTSATIYGLACPSATTCLAVGTGGTVLKTTNGGESFVAKGPLGGGALRSVACPSESHCVVVGEAGAVYTTANGGETFLARGPVGTATLYAVACPTESRCLAVGEGTKTYLSTNGGESWVAESLPVSEAITLRAVGCATTTECYAAGQTARYFKSENGGESWKESEVSTTHAFYGGTCFAAASCVAVGETGVIGALTFLSFASGGGSLLDFAPKNLYGAAFNTPYRGFAVGEAGTVVSFYTPCSSEALALSAPSSLAFPPAQLNGLNQATEATLPLTVAAEGVSLAGWSLSATSTPFTTATGHALPTTATTIVSVSATGLEGSCAAAENRITYPLALPAGNPPPTAVKFFAASPPGGLGPFALSPKLKLAIPANAYKGSYEATVTLTIASGP